MKKNNEYSRRELISTAIKTSLLTSILPHAKAASIHFSKTSPIQNEHPESIWVPQGDNRWPGLSQVFNQEVTASPLAIALCESDDDVISVLSYCQTHSLPFSIRSGGHCYMGFSMIDQGVVIDLSLMNLISYPQPGIARIEPGCTLGAIYASLYKQKGKCIPGGSCESVGISGLTLGGGMGWLNRLYGLTSDVLMNLEIIVPQQHSQGFKKIIASANENADLFWACRGGGGGNFGLVTAFEFQTCDIPGGETVFCEISIPWLHDDSKDTEQLKTIIKRWMDGINDFNLKAQTKQNYCYFFSGMALFSRANGPGISLSIWSFHDDPEINQNLYQEFINLLGVDDFPLATTAIQKQTYFKVMQLIAYGGESRHFYNNSGFCNSIISDDGISIISHFLLTTTYAISGAQNLVQFDSLGGRTADFDADFSAWPHRSAQFSLQFESYWMDESDKPGCIQWTSDFHQQLSPYLTGYCYRNYPCPENNGKVDRYYGQHMQRLIEIKRKWDPENVFSISQGIPAKEQDDVFSLK